MKSLLVVLIMALFAAVPAANAAVGFGVEGGLAMAQYDGYDGEGTTDMGVNVGLRATYPVAEKIALVGRVGYGMFFVGDEEFAGVDVTTTLSDIYIEVEGHYMFTDKFFGIAGVGMHMYTFEMEATYDFMGSEVTTTTDSGENKFGFNVGAGYMFNKKLSADVRYLLIADINQIKVNLVYSF